MILDSDERMRLIKLYESMPKEQLIELIIQDEKEYQRERYPAYELLLDEARKRNIEREIEAMKTSRREKEAQKEALANSQWVLLYRYYSETEGINLKLALESNNIPIHIIPYVSYFRRTHGTGEILVREADLESAKDILNDFKN